MNIEEEDIIFTEEEKQIEEREEEEELQPSPEDLALEAETKLTGEEEKWKAELTLRIKEWKAEASSHPEEIQRYIRGVKIDDLTPEDLELYHAFTQVQKQPSPYFRQKFGRLARRQIREAKGDYESTSFQLAKILNTLTTAEEE
ncbi:hypothetical protein C4546_04070 [Candidatus Parcubacteria bacterium]|jgi:hypothetical protein|nr:MAG: hypothetical protein C4546_04070 [Candidatus Parcubacteria bacterium]